MSAPTPAPGSARDDEPTRDDDTSTTQSHEETTMDPDRTQTLATDLGLQPAATTTTDLPSGADALPERERYAATSAADLPVAAPAADQGDGVRVGTVVWGLVLAAVGVGLIAVASGVTFDVELAVIVLIAAAGAALLVGSLVTAARRRRPAGGLPGAGVR